MAGGKRISDGELRYSFADFFQPYSSMSTRDVTGRWMPSIRRRPNFQRAEKAEAAIAINLLQARRSSPSDPSHKTFGNSHIISRPRAFGQPAWKPTAIEKLYSQLSDNSQSRPTHLQHNPQQKKRAADSQHPRTHRTGPCVFGHATSSSMANGRESWHTVKRGYDFLGASHGDSLCFACWQIYNNLRKAHDARDKRAAIVHSTLPTPTPANPTRTNAPPTPRTRMVASPGSRTARFHAVQSPGTPAYHNAAPTSITSQPHHTTPAPSTPTRQPTYSTPTHPPPCHSNRRLITPSDEQPAKRFRLPPPKPPDAYQSASVHPTSAT